MKMKSTEAPSGASIADGSRTVDRRSVVVGLSLAAGAGFSLFNTPRVLAAPIPEERFQRMIPTMVGRWRSRTSSELVLPAQDDLQEKLYENLETRIYEGIGLPSIMMLMAYSSVQKNDVQVHRPEICYPVAGYPILETRPALIDFGSTKIRARELVADRGSVKERIIYWIRVGEEFPVGYAEQRFAMAKLSATVGLPDGLLFRVSTFEESPHYTPQALRLFISAFERAVSEAFKKHVILGAATI